MLGDKNSSLLTMMKPPSTFFQLPSHIRRCSNLNLFHTKLNAKIKPQSEGEENNTINKDLEEIIDFKTKNNSSWIIEVITLDLIKYEFKKLLIIL